MKGSWRIEVETSVSSGTGEASVEKQVYVGFVLVGEGREKAEKRDGASEPPAAPTENLLLIIRPTASTQLIRCAGQLRHSKKLG
ncbi:hypothetical protein [Pseudomonas sp. MWU12-2037]|uniref:hypothetical protein n=1 Tax=Pseudomonas sp. MWU12-2037 TaxID=2928690 RepID=UPI00200DDC58|nr:hypothetical protein [Pseudomonas sp. MWU12-2037]